MGMMIRSSHIHCMNWKNSVSIGTWLHRNWKTTKSRQNWIGKEHRPIMRCSRFSGYSRWWDKNKKILKTVFSLSCFPNSLLFVASIASKRRPRKPKCLEYNYSVLKQCNPRSERVDLSSYIQIWWIDCVFMWWRHSMSDMEAQVLFTKPKAGRGTTGEPYCWIPGREWGCRKIDQGLYKRMRNTTRACLHTMPHPIYQFSTPRKTFGE